MITYYEFSSIETDLGIPLKTLFAVSNSLKSHYHKTKIPKRDGSFRTLTVPDEVLKKIQRSIVKNILAYLPVSRYATAYRYGTSVQKNAKVHVGKKKILKLDILHFFDSIMYSAVKDNCFPTTRFSEPVRTLLSLLCYYEDALPQGAPSSPIISNIIMREFDDVIGAWCEERNISYTRYCDDMTFSGEFDTKELLCMVKDELFKRGFLINSRKTVSLSHSKRQTVTGIVVNEKPNVSSDYKRSIRQSVYYCKKYGVKSHLEKIKSPQDERSYLCSLLGKISFVLQTVPNDAEFLGYKTEILNLIKNVTQKNIQ